MLVVAAGHGRVAQAIAGALAPLPGGKRLGLVRPGPAKGFPADFAVQQAALSSPGERLRLLDGASDLVIVPVLDQRAAEQQVALAAGAKSAGVARLRDLAEPGVPRELGGTARAVVFGRDPARARRHVHRCARVSLREPLHPARARRDRRAAADRGRARDFHARRDLSARRAGEQPRRRRRVLQLERRARGHRLHEPAIARARAAGSSR